MIWKGLTEKAEFDFVEFCNVIEWTLEQIKGKEQCYNYCTLIVRCCTGLELLIVGLMYNCECVL